MNAITIPVRPGVYTVRNLFDKTLAGLARVTTIDPSI